MRFLALLIPLLIVSDCKREEKIIIKEMDGRKRGKLLFYTKGCIDCHKIDGFGGNKGPDLSGIEERITIEYARKWIKNPKEIKPETDMLYLRLSDDEIEAIVTFLFKRDRASGND
jgi:ubiquinol-cytochrome c reductase cytochrome b subunit